MRPFESMKDTCPLCRGRLSSTVQFCTGRGNDRETDPLIPGVHWTCGITLGQGHLHRFCTACMAILYYHTAEWIPVAPKDLLLATVGRWGLEVQPDQVDRVLRGLEQLMPVMEAPKPVKKHSWYCWLWCWWKEP